MTNSDKDILITPNTGQTAKPKIEVTGANNTKKTIEVNDDGSLTFNSTIAATSGSVADGNANLVSGDAVFDYIEAQNFVASGESNFAIGDITQQDELGSGSLTSADEFVISDDGGTGTDVLKRISVSTLENYMQNNLTFTTDTNTFRTVTAGGNTLGASETLAFTAGSNVTITELDGAVTIASTDTNTQLTLLDEDDMSSNSATAAASQQSIKAYVDSEVSGLVDSAPSALDTLNELAAALGDDASFSTTTATSLGNRLRVDVNTQGLTSTQQGNALTNLGITASLAEINILDDGLAASDIPDLAASKITSGTLGTARIPSLATSKITSGTFADARVAESNVTQHQAALSITESQISDLQSYLTAPRTVTAGGQTLANNETLAFTAGSNVTITESGGAVTIASTDTNTQLTDAEVVAALNSDLGGDIVFGNQTDDNVKYTGTISVGNVNAAGSADITAAGFSTMNGLFLGYGSGPGYIKTYNSSDNLELYAHSGSAHVKMIELDAVNSNVNITGNITVSGSYNLASGDIPNNAADTSGNAATATALETARSIGGVSFDGTTNINLPGVNTAGNQNTTGRAGGLDAENDRDLAPEDLSYSNDFNVFFTSKEGLEDGTTNGSNYQDAIVLNTWNDSTGGDANLLAFDKSEMKIYHYQADQADTDWGTPKTIAYTDSDITGTASNVTVSDSTANTNFPVVFHDESNGLLDDTGALRYNPSTGTLLVPNLSVAGTTTQVNTVTMEAANAIVFEGATPDAYETTLTITDPTADRTITLPNASGTVAVSAGTGIDLSAAGAVSVDVSDFMANGADNRVLTATGTDAFRAEGGLTYDGSTLAVTGDLNVGSGDFFVDDSAGRVGIATTSPSRPLHVVGDAYVQNGDILLSRGNYYLQDASLADYRGSFASAGVWAWENVNVGIGTTSPAYNLDVASSSTPSIFIRNTDATHVAGDKIGSLLFFNAEDSSGQTGSRVGAGLRFVATDAYGRGRLELTAGTSNPMSSYNGTEDYTDDSIARLSILTDGGNVGIGTTSPSHKLHVSGSGAQKIKVESTDNEAAIELASDSSGPWVMYTANSSDDLRWYGNSAVRMSLTSAGNLGIGTTSPSTELEVAGSITVTGNDESVTFDGGTKIIGDHSSDGFQIRTQDTDPILFKTNGNNIRMSIEGDGKVGIGVTPTTALLEIGDGTDKVSIDPTFVRVFNDNGSGTNATVQMWAETWGGKVGTTSSDDFLLYAHNAERLKFDGAYRSIFYGSTSSRPIVRLTTKDTTVSDTDTLGEIQWTGDYDSDGGDTDLVAASISAVAEADFTATANTAALVFNTATSEAASEKMRITNDGKVGIGTTSPDEALEIMNGALKITREETENSVVTEDDVSLSVAGGLKWTFSQSFDDPNPVPIGTTTDNDVRIIRYNQTHQYFYWDRTYFSKKVGIGTTTIDAPLHVQSASDLLSIFESTDANAGIQIDSPNDGYSVVFFAEGGTNKWSLGKLANNSDKFSIYDEVNNTPRLVIDTDGDIGIGTLTPAATVDIKTGGSGSRTSFNAVADDLIVDSTGDTGITISSSSSSTGNVFFADADNDSRGQIRYDHAGNTMRFATSGTERFRIGSSGELGIGGATYGTSGQVLTSGGSGAAPTWTTISSGDITAVVAGNGLTGGATSGSATLNIGAGTGIDVAADAISVDVSDFMTNGSNNRVLTATGTDAMNAEANMTFDGSTLTVAGSIQGYKTVLKSVSSNTTLADADSGKTVYWTGGTLTLPATAQSGQQFVIINNTGASATPSLGTSNSIATGWSSHAAMDEATARTYIAVAANTWIYIG